MRYTVITSPGRFSDITAAAYSEKEIDWWNAEKKGDQIACTHCYAATELKKYLPGECELLSDRCGTVNGETVILVGGAKENAFTSQLEKKLNRSLGYAGAVKNSYRMLGLRYGDKSYVVLSGADRVGALYAAYAYLERLGVHFIEPGEPQYTEPDLSIEFDITEEPSFNARGAMSSFINGDIDFIEWMARNKFNLITLKKQNGLNHTQKKLGIDTVDGGHKIFYTFMQPSDEYPYRHTLYGEGKKEDDPYPVSKLCRKPSGDGGTFTYGDAHPEWYALVDGERRMMRFPEQFKKRGGARGDNICTGNSDATHELCTLIVGALADGIWKYVDYLNLWPIDNGTWCECEECKKQGSFSRRILLLAYKLDKYIKDARKSGRINRDIHIICPAYHETLEIPDQDLPDDFDYTTCSVVFYPIERCYLHNIDDPVCKETNSTLLGNLLPWTEKKTYKGELVIGEYYNVSTFAAMPFVLTSKIIHEIPVYYRLGARQFHYMHMPARDWGFIAVNNYLHGKLIWNVNSDTKKLTDGYFRARYGTNLAEKMKSIYAKVERATGNCKYYKHYQFLNGKRASLFYSLSEEEITEESLFPTRHMKLNSRAKDRQAGPSLKETLEGLREAGDMLNKVLEKASSEALITQLTRDARRLSYGIRMTEFLYLMCLCSLGQCENLPRLRALASEMECDTDSMQGYDFGENLRTALGASWISKTYYEKFSALNNRQSEENGILL